jgi:G protein-coupled receptor Mth (Methuselah protein)
MISLPFLLLTILTYCLIPELRNWHGKVLICYTVALTVTFGLLVAIDIEWIVDDIGTLCTTLAYCYYYSTLCCFTFLNVMGYDVWSSITGSKVRRSFHSLKKFSIYLTYALVVPALFVALALSMKFLDVKTMNPELGDSICAFRSGSKSVWIYLYTPVVFVLTTNLYFFIITAYFIFITQRKIANETDFRSKKETGNYMMFVRLFLLMGLTWILEIVGEFTDSRFTKITDLLNCSQGVMIFILFVCFGKTRQLVKKR